MKKIRIALAATILIGSFTASYAQNVSSGLTRMIADVEFLADDKLQGRQTGSKGEKKAASYISGRFKNLGLAPMGEDKFYQYFSVKPRYNPHAKVQADTSKAIKGRNVIGYIDNGAANTIVIGAHYDHLGWGEEGSLFEGERAIHNGADDNASGVAVMLHLATTLRGKYTANNYLLMAFSGEEKGLWGSSWFTKNPTIELANVNYMINLDMVGRFGADKKLMIYGEGTSPSWPPLLSDIAGDSIHLITKESGIGPSDHTSFYLKDMPVLHFFTGQHDDYHKPTDDVEKINYDGMAMVANFIEKIIGALDGQQKLEFTKTKDEESTKAPKFSVTLGVVPDYMYEGKGMRIDGVREDKPAMVAGIIAGDVVVQMGEIEVNDMMSYMAGLAAFKKGDKCMVTILRDGESLKVEVEF